MDIFEFVKQARNKGITLDYSDVRRYILLYGTEQEKYEFHKEHTIRNLDPAYILHKSEEWLETRELNPN